MPATGAHIGGDALVMDVEPGSLTVTAYLRLLGRRCGSGRDGSEPGRSVESRLIWGTVAEREMPLVVRVVTGWGGCRLVVAVCPPVRGCSWEGGRRAARRRRRTLGCEPV
jgi:hypothetical protein